MRSGDIFATPNTCWPPRKILFAASSKREAPTLLPQPRKAVNILILSSLYSGESPSPLPRGPCFRRGEREREALLSPLPLPSGSSLTRGSSFARGSRFPRGERERETVRRRMSPRGSYCSCSVRRYVDRLNLTLALVRTTATTATLWHERSAVT